MKSPEFPGDRAPPPDSSSAICDSVRQMGSFLKKILEASEQDAFNHLTWMEKSCINIAGLCSEDVPPSPNMGLPGALIPRQPPGPAYVTHTGPLVRLLLQQERPGRASGPASASAPARPGPGPSPSSARPRPAPHRAPRLCGAEPSVEQHRRQPGASHGNSQGEEYLGPVDCLPQGYFCEKTSLDCAAPEQPGVF